jgi:hypothetical protein
MAKPIVDDPNVLAGVVQAYGGTVIPGQVFRFDLPLEKVREVIPKLNELGVGCRKVGEYITDHPTKIFCPMGVATIELFRPDEREVNSRNVVMPW